MLIIEGDVDPRGVCAIEQLLAAEVCRSAVYLQQTASTNTRALSDLTATGSPSHPPLEAAQLPRLYLADCQTGGRGRRGRSWTSSDQTLTFSLLLQAAGQPIGRMPPLLPLAVGVGVAQAIEFLFAPLRAWLKWPNDIYLDGGKVAGILLETQQNSAGLLVAGVGINVGSAPEIPADASAAAAKSIAQCVGRSVPRYDILPEIISAVIEASSQADRQPGVIVKEFRQRCLLTGRQVSFQMAGRQHSGRCAGVTETGELVVETAAGRQHCHSGEVSFVRW